MIGSSRRSISEAGATLISSSAKSMPASSSAISSSNCAFTGREPARDGTLRLLRRDARLVERGGVDQVADGFGLRQIDAAVQESAQREFARLGKPRARAHGPVETMPQHDGRAMAGDFDYVFGGVGTRRGEVRDDDFVDDVAFVVEQFAEGRGPGTQFALQRDQGGRRSAADRGPERRTTPMPPRPGGVEIAAMVSFEFQA